MKKSSWKTTVGGILSAAGTAMTNSENATVAAIGKALSVLGLVILGLAARDNNVTSEQSGAK